MEKKNTCKKQIFTYLDCYDTVPPYMNLCIKTWQKNLPEVYEIVLLKKDNLSKYMPDGAYNSIPGYCSFPFFFDFVASAVLYKNGGIFLDAETVMSKKFLVSDLLLTLTELIFFGHDEKEDICPGFMMANAGADVLRRYIKEYGEFYCEDSRENFERNALMKKIIKDSGSEKVLTINSENFGYQMEQSLFGVYNEYIYKKYYFSNICKTEEFFEYSKGLTVLNNIWTPENYKTMNEEEFLKQDIFLAKIFNQIFAN